ncbi:hypothetical protein ONS95_001370 [Cadophora gregata]|uniref:uncharacterized protein n=1 Tax=Cadophora gregata TaxID=51156 RepID=UPI0026DD3DB0|nr:uncharacterized protein ONS95_001370 [Cadophora gregata]KAK0110989.1 hypothetical protein ONS95_001370 [Cadophora gregata]KAK0112552.1 hypothetical protein ONS96_001787 [Cadophora gregata f. sp. sojae]
MARTNPTVKSSSRKRCSTSVVTQTPQRDPHPILPPTPEWKKARAASEARKQLKRSRTSIEDSSASSQSESIRYRRILPPRPNYIFPCRQTRSLDPPSIVPQVEDVSPMCNSQPDENTEQDELDTWSPKRLRSRSSQVGQGMYTEREDDSMDDSDGSSEDNESIVDAEPLEEKEYDVEAIDGERIAPGVHEYWIRWVGYLERTWTASTDCFCPDLIADLRAVQGADLRAAKFSGREEEADVLQRLRYAARTRAEDDKSKRATKSHDAHDGRFQEVLSQPIMDSVEHSESSGDEHDIKSEPDLPRDARANTAWRRLGSTERDLTNSSQYITWYRSEPIDVDQHVSQKSKIELVEAWRADTVSTEMEGLDDGWDSPEAALPQARIDQKLDVDMQYTAAHDSQSSGGLPSPLSASSSSSAHSHGHPATATIGTSTTTHTSDEFGSDAYESTSTAPQQAERNAAESELRSISLFIKEAVDIGHGDLAARAILGARSNTPIKDEAEEARKQRKRNSERKVQRLLDDASFAAAPTPLSPPPRWLHDASDSRTSNHSTSASKKDLLRTMREDAARVESIKKVNLNTSRRQLDSTSPRSVQEVVRHAKVLAVQMLGPSQTHQQLNMETRSAISG